MNDTTRAFVADPAFTLPPPPEQERMVEAMLFASPAPLSARDIAERLPTGCDVGEALAGLRARYAGRKAAASPATGLAKRHLAEQGALIADALGHSVRTEIKRQQKG